MDQLSQVSFIHLFIQQIQTEHSCVPGVVVSWGTMRWSSMEPAFECG